MTQCSLMQMKSKYKEINVVQGNKLKVEIILDLL